MQTKKLSFKERQKQRREEEIIHAAGHLMREHGYDNLNMDMLAERVGISKPTLYQHFSSKDDLVAQVMMLSLEAMEAQLQEDQTGTPLEQLETVMRAVLNKSCDKSHILGNVGGDLVMATLHSPKVIGHRMRLMNLLRELVEEAKQNAEIPQALHTDVIVNSIFALVGVVKRFASAKERPPEADIHAAIETAVTLFMSGIRAR